MRLLLLAVLSLSTCMSSSAPAVAAAPSADAGTPAPSPSTPAPEAPLTVEPASGGSAGGCADDSQCAAGTVCVHCGPKSSCETGCDLQRPCPEGQRCVQVQCIRCPCPARCE